MKVAVLGAGVIGVTSAWYLAEAGHEVIVIDRQPAPALETSFANAGEISPGYASPWAAPGIPMKALKWMFMRHAPLILRPRADLAMMRWIASMLRECSSSRYRINKSRMMGLAEYSRGCLSSLRQATGITYDERSLGTLQVFRSDRQLEGLSQDLAVLQDFGVPHEILDRQGCLTAEPGLEHSRVHIAGGLQLPRDETGDCYKFTRALAELARIRGVQFCFGETVESLKVDDGRVTALLTQNGVISADSYLLCMASFTPALVRRIGIRMPVYPVKGYSLTMPIARPDIAPASTVLDETYKVAITRLGDRIRVGGMAELVGFSDNLPLSRKRTLEITVDALFPGAGHTREALFWSGLRPMTPDGTPIVGPTSISNLYLNTGHGTLGWTMACGSGQIVADLISCVPPSIPATDYHLSRYSPEYER